MKKLNLKGSISPASLKKHTSQPVFSEGCWCKFLRAKERQALPPLRPFPHPQVETLSAALGYVSIIFAETGVLCCNRLTLVSTMGLSKRWFILCHQIEVVPEELRRFMTFFMRNVCKSRSQLLKRKTLGQVSAFCARGLGDMFLFLLSFHSLLLRAKLAIRDD